MTDENKSLYGFEVRETDDRRAKDPSQKKVNIKQLWQRSHEILNLAVQGFSNKHISEILGCTPATVSNTINSDLGREKLSKMREERDSQAVNVSSKVDELTEKALEVYENILNSETAGFDLQKKTADTVLLEIGGHRAPTKIQSHNVSTTATLDQIEDFKARGIQAAKDSGMLIDITPGESNEEDT